MAAILSAYFLMTTLSGLGPGWMCWATDQSKRECGTVAYSKSKKLSSKAALKLCRQSCSSSCILDYCEAVK